MNKKDREELEEIKSRLDTLAILVREKADNMAEFFSGTEKAQILEDEATALESAVETLEEIE